VMPTAADNSIMSQVIFVQPFTRYVMYVEAHPVATNRHGAVSNMLVFTTDMSGQSSVLHALHIHVCVLSLHHVIL